ncbi:MAG TPA: hypothetical protein PK946_08030 [Tenuifilaceae bacterium]|nr:hypothetical protein [Tenuifilaceae bacterium]
MKRIQTALWSSYDLHRQHTLSRLFISKLFHPFRACKKSFAPYKGLRPLLLITPLRGLNPSGYRQVPPGCGQVIELT